MGANAMRIFCEECGSVVTKAVAEGVFECLDCGVFFDQEDYAIQNDTIRRKKYTPTADEDV
jgi:ribosomal protein L37AE/L43A